MKENTREHLHSSRFYLGMILGGLAGGLLDNAIFGSGSVLGLALCALIGSLIGTLIVKPGSMIFAGVTGAITGVLVAGFIWLFAGPPAGTILLTFGFGIVIGFLGGVIVNYCQTSHTIVNVFHSPRFVVGFVIITAIILIAVFYPMIDTRDSNVIYGDGFLKPGTYFSIYDANIAAFNSTTVHRIDMADAEQTRADNFLPPSQLEVIVQYLARKSAWEQGHEIYYNTMSDPNDPKSTIPTVVADVIQNQIDKIVQDNNDLNYNITKNQADIANARNERTRRNYQNRIDGQLATIEANEAKIATLRKNLEDGVYITDADAIALWSSETGLSASSEYREQLLELWAQNYDAVMAAQSSQDLQLLGIDGFNNGTNFITEGTGLRFQQADSRAFARIGRALTIDPKGSMKYIQTSSKGSADPIEQDVQLTAYTTVGEVANSINFPLGTDNFGHDMWLRLVSAIGKSLLIGLLAGSIATFLGILVGLLAGYVGGFVDDLLTFNMNIFTVIPGFVLIIIIYNAMPKDQRGIVMCGSIIGCTSWVWTGRSVRSQVISLRNRDHVNLSKLSGHSLFRIILTDILPYIASYVVMAFILQVSSGILAEAQLSILGLGPDEAKDGATLGLLMNWAKLFGAYTSSNAWWAYFPVIGTIALISFSLNLMNTGLDQVFNPTLRD